MSRLVRGHGTTLAETCDSQDGRDKFWRAVVTDRISFDEIKALGESLCPCTLTSFAQERDFLRQLLFGASGGTDQQTRRRSNSLRVLLTFLSQSSDGTNPWNSYRQTAYYGQNASGKRFATSAALEKTVSRWAIYQAGEYVNRALEEILLAVLEKASSGLNSRGGVRRRLRSRSPELFVSRPGFGYKEEIVGQLCAGRSDCGSRCQPEGRR